MKFNLCKSSTVSLLVGAVAFTSCVDNDKNLFDVEKTKELYQSSFPVQNIDPSMDWKTTQGVNVSVSVNEDMGTNYKVQLFDANPLNKNSNARLLAEGYANQDMKLETTMDCPTALTTVFVARVDNKGRYIVKPANISNGKVAVAFGNGNTIVSRATRSVDFTVPTMEAPYSEQEIASKLQEATEIQQDWNLGAMQNWDKNKYEGYDIFNTPNNQPRFFKITSPCTDILYSSGSATIKVIVATKLTLTKTPDLSGHVELIVVAGGEIVISDGLKLSRTSQITVLGDGKITGEKLELTNVGSANPNYNAGTIELDKFTMSEPNGLIYNCGTFKVDNLDIRNNTTKLVNQGKAYIEETHTRCTIENGCYLEVEDFDGVLRLGELSSATIETYNKNRGDNPDLTLGKNSILNIEKAYLTEEHFHGPSNGYALVKIEEVEQLNNFQSAGNIYYEIKEFDDDISTEKWMDRFYDALKNSEGTISKFGESPITIPAGDCTGEGNTPNESGEEIEVNPMNYTYAFEDNYPSAGDYDFNDIVLNVSTEYTKEKSTNAIKSIQYNITLSAVGATKQLGAALRLVDVNKSAIASVSFNGRTEMRSTLANSMFENSAIESNGNEVVIPLFGDAHQVYGFGGNSRPMLNTDQQRTNEVYTLKVIITLTDQSKTAPVLTKDNLDFFIAYSMGNQSPRTEIHLYEFRKYGATANGNVHKENLDAAGNLTWGISVPEFKYPTEMTKITDAYPQFEAWAQNHTSNLDWYKYPTDKTDKKYIFE